MRSFESSHRMGVVHKFCKKGEGLRGNSPVINLTNTP